METSTQEQNVEVATSAKRGRPEKMNKERVEQLIKIAKDAGRTLKAVCAERHIPYITVVVARKRHGLQEKDLKAVAEVVAA
jgi:transposase